MKYSFAVAMLLAGTVNASGQIASMPEPQDQSMWSVSMDPQLEISGGKECTYKKLANRYIYGLTSYGLHYSRFHDNEGLAVQKCKDFCLDPRCAFFEIYGDDYDYVCNTQSLRGLEKYEGLKAKGMDIYIKKKCFDKAKPEEIWKDIQDLKTPGKALLNDFQEYENDQAKSVSNIERSFEEAMVELDTPKHRSQLAKIKARWDTLQVYQDQEMAVLHGEIEQFVFQDDVSAELEDLENDIAKILDNMMKRDEDFQHELQGMQPFFTDMEKSLRAILVKLNRLATTVKQNIQFDSESKMWKLSMDNKVSDGLKNDQKELVKDGEKFVKSNPEVEAEMNDLSGDLMEELHEIEANLQESAKMLEDPRYKGELEAIVNKMKALDMKFKNNLKIEQ